MKRRKHYYLRITQILKNLAYINLEECQLAWLRFLITEIFVTKELKELDNVMTKYWIHTIRDDKTRIRFINDIELLIKIL